MIVDLDYATDEGYGGRARLGLIVLESDQTLEAELRMVSMDGVAHFVSRIAMEPIVSTSSLTAMEQRLPAAASLLPTDLGLDAIGYGCTSAATLIGEEAVEEAIGSVHPGVPCTNPISAMRAALGALRVDRIGVVTPYTAEVTAGMVAHLEQRGVGVAAVGSFLEEDDRMVSHITEAAVAAAAGRIGARPGCRALFVSCTSLRTFGIIGELEADLGIPVVSSNQALYWHMLRLAGVDDAAPGLGRLFTIGLDGEAS